MTSSPLKAEEIFRRELPYIGAVILLLVLGASSLFARRQSEAKLETEPAVSQAETSPADTPPQVLTGVLCVLAGGLVVLGVCAYRLVRGQPLLAPTPAPPTRWGVWDVLKLFAVFLVLPSLAVTALRLVCFAADESYVFVLGQTAAALVTIAAAVHVVCVDRANPPESLGLTRERLGRCARIGFLACLGFLPIHFAVAMLQSWLAQQHGIVLPEQESVRLVRESPDLRLVWTLTFHAGLVAPSVEEVLFRALLLPLLMRWMRPGFAIAATATVFSACHPYAQAVVPIFLLGAALGYVYHRTRSLVSPVVFHMTYNGFVLIVLLVQRGGP